MNRYKLEYDGSTITVVDSYLEEGENCICVFSLANEQYAKNYQVFLNIEYQLALDKKLSNNPIEA